VKQRAPARGAQQHQARNHPLGHRRFAKLAYSIEGTRHLTN
jgi:hypothetical protein